MKVSLAPALEKFVKSKVKEGWYRTPGEVVADALRRWKEADANGQYEPDWLEQAIEEGIDSGQPIPVDEKFWTDLRRDVQKRLSDRITPYVSRRYSSFVTRRSSKRMGVSE